MPLCVRASLRVVCGFGMPVSPCTGRPSTTAVRPFWRNFSRCFARSLPKIYLLMLNVPISVDGRLTPALQKRLTGVFAEIGLLVRPRWVRTVQICCSRLMTRRARHRVSRGQQKMLAAALVIAQTRFLAAHTDAGLVLLVDDPAAELDRDNRERLFNMLQQMPVQMFVTALEAEDLPWSARGSNVPCRPWQGHLSAIMSRYLQRKRNGREKPV